MPINPLFVVLQETDKLKFHVELCYITSMTLLATQIHTQIGYVQSDMHEFSTTVRSTLP